MLGRVGGLTHLRAVFGCWVGLVVRAAVSASVCVFRSNISPSSLRWGGCSDSIVGLTYLRAVSGGTAAGSCLETCLFWGVVFAAVSATVCGVFFRCEKEIEVAHGSHVDYSSVVCELNVNVRLNFAQFRIYVGWRYTCTNPTFVFIQLQNLE